MDIKRNIQKDSSLSMSLLDMRMEQFAISLSKKCDRLATALYLVTNFLSDTEPLKLRLRALSLDLVRGAVLVRYGTIQDESNVLGTMVGNIAETQGLFELAFINGLISEMNFSILKREYVSLSDAIHIRKTSRTSRTDTLFEKSFFGPSVLGEEGAHTAPSISRKESPSEIPETNSEGRPQGGYSQGQHKGQPDIKDKLSSNKMSDSSTNIQERKINKGDKGHGSPYVPLSIKSRRVRIIKLVKDKREVSIKDISDHFPEISEKTIQRELVSLAESGVFKKTGSRRWSRYSLL